MWPMLLDMTQEESVQSLRHLELEAYSSLVSALRAQGSLSTDKKKILRETSMLLNISTDRHKAEIRRAISDEKLNTIAYHITGQLNSLEDWALEGRRLTPLLPRIPPQTPYSVIADEASEAASLYNKQLPLPFNTERKRPLPQTVTPSTSVVDTNGKPAFRIPEAPKEENKRRKCNSVGETSSLAQHLLGPKLTKIQQIYRQASKAKQKPMIRESIPDIEHKDLTKIRPNGAQPQHIHPPVSTSSKINIIQNISIPSIRPELAITEDKSVKEVPMNDIHTPVTKCLTLKPTLFPNSQHSVNMPSNDMEPSEATKANTVKKTISIGQKVIVVSNSQTMPSNNSILQKTLSVPMNKLTKLNLDNFKIIPNAHLPSTPGLQVQSRHLCTPKPKLVTIKGTSNKKLISLSKLQMLNAKTNLKMVPYDGKINNVPSSVVNIPPSAKPPFATDVVPSCLEGSAKSFEVAPLNATSELNGIKGNGDKASDDSEANEDNFRLSGSNYCELDLGCSETLSSESSETDERNSNDDGSSVESVELENCDLLETQHDGEVLQEFEVVHTEELLQ